MELTGTWAAVTGHIICWSAADVACIGRWHELLVCCKIRFAFVRALRIKEVVHDMPDSQQSCPNVLSSLGSA